MRFHRHSVNRRLAEVRLVAPTFSPRPQQTANQCFAAFPLWQLSDARMQCYLCEEWCCSPHRFTYCEEFSMYLLLDEWLICVPKVNRWKHLVFTTPQRLGFSPSNTNVSVPYWKLEHQFKPCTTFSWLQTHSDLFNCISVTFYRIMS